MVIPLHSRSTMARPLSEAARAKMIQAAQAIIVEHGLDTCTIEEVARRSGVAKTTIYRHFGNADELVLAAVDEMIEDVAPPDTGTLRGDLAGVVLVFRDVVRKPFFRQFFASMLSKALIDPEFAVLYRDLQEMRHAPLRVAIQRGMARGEVDPEIDLELAMYFVQGPFVAKRMVENEDISDREIDAFLDFIVRALAPQSAA